MNTPTRCFIGGLALACMALGLVQRADADDKDGRFDIYFIDVEGGAATLFVSPSGESLLIDSGYPDNGGRDLNRILNVLRDVAGRKHLDHAVVSPWHLDHFGNHAALASQISIKNFWDRIPETSEIRRFPNASPLTGPPARTSRNLSKSATKSRYVPGKRPWR